MGDGITRRDALKGLTALGAAGLTSGVGITFGQGGALSATTYPGAWEEAHRSILIPAYRRATNNASVNLVASLAVDTVSKLVAAKANPPYDAIILDEGPYIAALQHDVFAPLPADKIPNLKDLPKKFIDTRGFGAFCSAQIIGLGYNTDKIKNPPKSWNDLLSPEYKGRVGLSSMGSTLISAWMVEIARTNAKVPYSAALQQYAKDAAQLEGYHGVDWVKLNPKRAEYIDRFNREVKV